MIAPAYGAGGTAGGGGSGGGGPDGPLTINVSPLVAYGSRASASAVTVPSENITLTITGGTGSYTITWEIVSAPSGTWTITAPSSLTTKYQRAAIAAGASYVGTLRAKVFDGVTTIYSATVEVDLNNTGTL
jgi:hypothetical protein